MKIKKMILLLGLLSMSLFGCSGEENSEQNEPIVTEDTLKTDIVGTENIWIIGDSLAAYASPKGNGSAGWGSYLQLFLKTPVYVRNTAVGGTSASSYVRNGAYDLVMNGLKENDVVLIQFGHNDAWNMEIYTDPYGASSEEGSFKEILKNDFILPILEKGAYPILTTSVVAADFDETGQLYTMIYSDHAQAMRELVEECQAEELPVYLIDTYTITADYYNEIGESNAQALHSGGNHYNRDGAIYAAGIVAEELQKLGVSCFDEMRTQEEVESIDEAGGYNIYALGASGMVTYEDISELKEQYLNEGMDENLASEEAERYMLQKEALYQAALNEGCKSDDSEVEAALNELKNSTEEIEIRRALHTYITEEAYWNYQEYVIKRNLTVNKYIEELEAEYIKQTKNDSSALEFDEYLNELKETLADAEEYVFIINRGFNLEY